MDRLLRHLLFQLRFGHALAYVPNVQWAALIAHHRLNPRRFALDRASNALHLRGLPFSPLTPEHGFVLGQYRNVVRLIEESGARFQVEDSTLTVQIGALRLSVQTAEEIYVLREVFAEGVYNLDSRHPTTVVDIGMNVGFASLFFASLPFVTRVLSYEPFWLTFNQARHNIAQNPSLAAKIEPRNYGLAASTRAETLDYSPSTHARAGLFGYQRPGYLEPKDVVHQSVLMVAADRALAEALVGSEPHQLAIKMDCEGCEYEILPRLRTTDYWPRVASLMIEWHTHGPDALVDVLRADGFEIFSLSPRSPTTGMIYAVRAVNRSA